MKTDNILLEVGVKVFLKNKNKYLFLKRAKPYPNQTICKWDIPGGRINPGEEVLKALAREVKEETGLILKGIDKILSIQDIKRVAGKHTVRITFLVNINGTKVKLDPAEHQNYQWLIIPEFKKLKYDRYLSPVIKENFK